MFSSLTDAVVLRILIYVCIGLLLLSVGFGIWGYVNGQQRDAAIANSTALEVKLDLQNAAVRQWQKEAASQAQLVAAAVVEAGKVQVVTKERVERIQSAPVPSTCPEAVTWGAIEGAKQAAEWEGK